jgi:hypothetical protein
MMLVAREQDAERLLARDAAQQSSRTNSRDATDGGRKRPDESEVRLMITRS